MTSDIKDAIYLHGREVKNLQAEVRHQARIIENLKALVKSIEDELNELKQQVKDGAAS